MKKDKLLALFGSVCLVLALVMTLSGGLPAVFADKPQDELPPGIEKAVEPELEVLPPSIQPVVILQGDDYDMGYQYGYQAAAEIDRFRKLIWAEMMGEGKEFPGGIGYGGFSREKIEEALKGFQQYIIEYAPEFIDIFMGMADGATDAGYPMTYFDCLLINVEWDMGVVAYDLNYPEEVEALPPHGWPHRGCSTFAAWGDSTPGDVELVSIHSTDTDIRNVDVIVAFPDEGNAVISAGGEPGVWGFTYLQNDKGLYVGMTASGSYLDENNQYGLPASVSLFRLARWCDDAEEAKDMLMDTQLTNGMNYVVADPSGTAYVVETSGGPKAYREPDDNGEGDFIVAANHYLTDEMQPSQDYDYTYVSGSSPARYDQLFTALDSATPGDVDIEFAKEQLRTPPVCRPYARGTYIGVCEEEKAPRSYFCLGAASTAGGGCSWYWPIEPTYSFYELVLEDSPLGVVRQAKGTALAYASQAIDELNQLTYADVEYAPLNELLIRAKTEYYRGWTAQDEGQLAAIAGDINESLNKYHEAVTAYTKCQAIALQVYNALA